MFISVFPISSIQPTTFKVSSRPFQGHFLSEISRPDNLSLLVATIRTQPRLLRTQPRQSRGGSMIPRDLFDQCAVCISVDLAHLSIICHCGTVAKSPPNIPVTPCQVSSAPTSFVYIQRSS